MLNDGRMWQNSGKFGLPFPDIKREYYSPCVDCTYTCTRMHIVYNVTKLI